MSESTKKSILLQGSILAVAGIITKIIGFIYRIPMANIIGNSGNGIYSVAFGIYNVALTLSSYSMPLAVSKLMTERIVKGNIGDARKTFKLALIFASCTGLIAFLVLFFGADFIAYLYKTEGLARPLRILAPTTLVVAILGTCRGYYQGQRNMVPTAISQVIEQIVNAFVSVFASYEFVKACNNPEDISSYGAMGGTTGTLMGAIFALALFGALFIAGRFNNTLLSSRENADKSEETNVFIFKCIILTVIPVVISQSIYQFGSTFDDFIYGNVMNFRHVDPIKATSMQGVFNTQYNQMINLPVAIATAMASATLPSVVASYTIGDMDRVREKTDMVLKTNMIIAIPSAVGLAVLAEPIMTVLFPALNEYKHLAVMLIRTGSSAVIFYALSTLTTSMLQGCNHMNIPVIHSGISLAVHAALVFILLRFTDMGVYARVVGNISFPLLVMILNIRSVRRFLNYRFKIKEHFVKPFVCSALMGAICFTVYYFMNGIFGSERRIICGLILAITVLIGIISYAVILVLTGTLGRDELRQLPIIKKFVK